MEFVYSDEVVNTIKTTLANTTKHNHYNGWNNRTLYGYHSFKINNIDIPGQRQPWIRLNKMKEHYDFKDKTLIDFGCNSGGMIFHLPELKKAFGLDFNKECIDSCNYMASILKHNTEYSFIQQDLNFFNLPIYLYDNNLDKVDVIFLLALGSWIKNWKDLYKQCVEHSNNIILETNNDNEGKPQLEFFKSLNCAIKLISNESDDDLTHNLGRKTYLITPIQVIVGEVYCKHYLLPNRSLLNHNMFQSFFNNLKYKHFFINDHICLDIRDSMHYKVLTEEVDFNLYNSFITITNQKEHSIENFKQLIKDFDINNMPPIQIYNYENKYFIKDGCHRFAILHFKNIPDKEKHLTIV